MMANPPELAWRVSTAEELFRNRQRRWRTLLTAAAVFFVVAFTFTESARWFGMLATVALTGVVWSWQRTRETRFLSTAEPNIRLNQVGFNWRNQRGEWQTLPRGLIRGYRINPALQPGDKTALVFLLQDDFESQSIASGSISEWEPIRDWLAEHWQLEEIPSPAPSDVVVASVRWDGVYEYDLATREIHWFASRQSLLTLAEVLLRAANEIPEPPLGAKPKWFEVVGPDEGEEFLIGVDSQAWIDGGCLAGPASWLRNIVSPLQEKLQAGETFFTISAITFSRPWTLGFHVDDEDSSKAL